eukprot:TRINITY_DN8618_c0_g1_i1.p1 TRINITY_DN8618_c0_g1~~TRINITY_DN8618_c0_g1_i1.p1  ORF type:complete len:635 (-),score=246.50 TRINITY_DN8618_c0_g1_i1:29-1933(-)
MAKIEINGQYTKNKLQQQLVGLILVIHNSLGENQLVFRYPPVVRANLSSETKQHHLNTLPIAKKSELQNSVSTPELSKMESDAKNTKISLTKITNEIDNKKVNDKSNNTNQKMNTNFASSRDQSLGLYQLSSVLIAPMLFPKPQLCNRAFELTVENLTFIGFPTLLRSQNQNLQKNDDFILENDDKETDFSDFDAFEQEISNNTNKLPESEQLTFFHLVFAVRNLEDEEARNIVRLQARKFAAALLYEEKRVNYLSIESKKLQIVREKWLAEALNGVHPDHQKLTEQLLICSKLANEIKDIFLGLRTNGQVHLQLNSSITLSLSLNKILPVDQEPIRPHQTLLILDSDWQTSLQFNSQTNTNLYPFNYVTDNSFRNKRKSSSTGALKQLGEGSPMSVNENQVQYSRLNLNPDTAATLLQLLKDFKYQKPFRELALNIGIPFVHLCHIGAHLVYWEKARIIDRININTYFVLNSNFQITTELLVEFNKLFGPNFYKYLEIFSTPKQFPVDKKTEAIDLFNTIVWLLSKKVIVQLRTYIFLNIVEPIENKLNNDSTRFVDFRNNSNNNYLTDYELQVIEKLNDKTPIYELFKQLAPYFRGQYHLEEILWLAKLKENDLKNVLTKYSSLIVQCQIEH